MPTPEIWEELASGYLEKSHLEVFEANVLLGKVRNSDHAKVLADHFHYYSNQEISRADGTRDYKSFVPSSGMPFLKAAEVFFSKYSHESIGVQLSGGLDSTLIIGCLRHLGVPHTLIGYTTDRFEFRTERHVQELLLGNAAGLLLNHDETLPFSGVRDVPPHQVPETVSLGHNIGARLADEAQRLGITLLLSGTGGDLLLGGDASASRCSWRISMFDNPFEQDLIYSPRRITCRSFYSDPEIASSIWTLRRGQREDSRKSWARRHFGNLLPMELVDYAYKADFWGLRIDGLSENKTGLLQLEEEAYDLTRMEYFRKNSIKPLLEMPNTQCEMDINQRIEARAAAAVWVVSLKRSSNL